MPRGLDCNRQEVSMVYGTDHSSSGMQNKRMQNRLGDLHHSLRVAQFGERGVPPALPYRPLDDCRQVLQLSLAQQLIKTGDGEFLEMGGGAVELGGGSIAVLLIDHDHVGVIFDGVRNIADTARLLA
jgi:hypothetical protein